MIEPRCPIRITLVLLPLGAVAVAGCSRLERPFGTEPGSGASESPVIASVVFDDRSLRTAARGSDNWPVTWAADGTLYTTWGDGGGFGGTDAQGRVGLGIARIEGSADDYVGVNIAGGVGAPADAPFEGKSVGILALGDTLYLWRNGDGSSQAAFRFSQLYRSVDRGLSWSFTGVEFRRGADFTGSDLGFFSLTFCQFGPGYGGARDEYVYIYGPEISDASHWDVQKPGRIALMRVPRSSIADRSSYEFFAGLADGAPTWTATLSRRRPVWEDPLGGTHRMAVSFNAGIGRYLLTTMTEDRVGKLALYDAPEPWGPWTRVFRDSDTRRWGAKTVVFNFVNKWLSEDGTAFVMVYTRDDHWATIRGRFELTDAPGPSP